MGLTWPPLKCLNNCPHFIQEATEHSMHCDRLKPVTVGSGILVSTLCAPPLGKYYLGRQSERSEETPTPAHVGIVLTSEVSGAPNSLPGLFS